MPRLIRSSIRPCWQGADSVSRNGAAGTAARRLAERFRATIKPGDNAMIMLVRLNQRIATEINYLVRMEPGVQTPDETLERGCGSCRDTGWLLVQILRHMGLAARFASGYLIQLVADVKPLEGPSGPDRDFTDLHAWAEVFLPGAGWIGFDPTSGLLAGEGHIPLACTADPGNAAPVIGYTDITQDGIPRRHDRYADPRGSACDQALHATSQWAAIDDLGEQVDRGPCAHGRAPDPRRRADIRLDRRHGRRGVEHRRTWGQEARTCRSRCCSGSGRALRQRGFVHFGQGKWYPGEPLPRWALGIYWRVDGRAVVA